MNKLICLEKVSKIYNPGDNMVKALDKISLTVDKGEFIAVVGASGSGKSTLMNILGCLDVPDKGIYHLDNIDVSSLRDKELSKIRNREIGFIFQGFNLIPNMTALENVALPLYYRGLSREVRESKALSALSKVGLSSRANHRPSQLSGGQQQRVAIARALAGEPPLLLADEPTGNLDSETGKDIMALLTELWKRGSTIIIITHDKRVANIANRKIVIKDGKVV